MTAGFGWKISEGREKEYLENKEKCRRFYAAKTKIVQMHSTHDLKEEEE